MHVSLFTDAGNGIGYGHLIRSFSICQALTENHIFYDMYVSSDALPSYIKRKHVHLLRWHRTELSPLIQTADIAVIDSYTATLREYRSVSRLVPLVIIDDNNRLSYPDGLIVNGGLYAESLQYNHNKGSYVLGSSYTPLRKVFWKTPKKQIHNSVHTVFIRFGTKDVAAGRIVKKLQNEYPKIDFYWADINLPLNEMSMYRWMLKSDISVSGSGQTLHELIRLGVPTVAVGVAGNQENNILFARNHKLIRFAGWITDYNIQEKVLKEFRCLFNFEERHIMHQRMIKVIDGQGARRIAKAILSYYESRRSHQ